MAKTYEVIVDDTQADAQKGVIIKEDVVNQEVLTIMKIKDRITSRDQTIAILTAANLEDVKLIDDIVNATGLDPDKVVLIEPVIEEPVLDVVE